MHADDALCYDALMRGPLMLARSANKNTRSDAVCARASRSRGRSVAAVCIHSVRTRRMLLGQQQP